MNRTWMLVALAALLSVTASGQPKPAENPPEPNAFRQLLEKKGYVAVPLTQGEADERFTVECKIGTEACRFLLDTGADRTILDTALVKKLGLKHGDAVEKVGIGGVEKGFEVTLRGMSIGTFNTRAVSGPFTLMASDLSDLNAVQDRRKLRRIDGLLGHKLLRSNSAVIDYPARTLYLCTPLNRLWPEIEGRWVASEGQEDGRVRQIDPAAPPRLEFKDRTFRLTDGNKQYLFGIHTLPVKNGHAMVFFHPEKDLAKELVYKAIGLLKVADGRLTVCLCLDNATAVKGMPEDFKAPADSGRLLLEFRREK